MKRISLLVLLLFVVHQVVLGRGDTHFGQGSLSLSFWENKGQILDQHGQARNDIDFVLKGGEMTLFIGAGSMHYQFVSQQKPQSATTAGPYQVAGGAVYHRIDVSLLGANKNAEVIKELPQKTVHHFYNTQGENGLTNVASYGKITYKEIYPNIDWVVYTQEQRLKYDFIVHPGGSVNDIQWQYSGAESVHVGEDGSLHVVGSLGQLTEEAPYLYEKESKRQVEGSFKLLDKNTVCYQVAPFEGTLVVDPGVEWATYFGGPNSESSGQCLATDQDENVYLAGLTSSLSNIATTGAHQDSLSGATYDAFVAKFDSTGNLVWSTYYGGTGTGFLNVTQATGVATDANGNVYVGGITDVNSGIATAGSFLATAPTNSFMNGFLVRFNNDGTRQWGTYYGGNLTTPALFVNATRVLSVASDNLGNVYIGGGTDSLAALDANFITTGAHQTAYGGGFTDGWVAKFDSMGNRTWATFFGNSGIDEVNGLAVDDSNHVYIGGGTNSPTGIATAGTHEDTYGSNSGGGFVTKFSSGGEQQWGSYLRGGWSGVSLAIDDFAHLYVASTVQSSFADTFIYTPNCHLSILEENSQQNGFLMRFNKNEGTRDWGTYYGADNATFITGVATNNAGNVIVSGYTNSYADLTTETIATQGSHQESLGGATGLSNPPNDGFLVQFDSTGVRTWASYYGGADADQVNACVLSPNGALYIAGESGSTSNIATPDAHQATKLGTNDAFLVRWLSIDINLDALLTPENDTICTGDIPLVVRVKNDGRKDKVDSLIIGYTLDGSTQSSSELSFGPGLTVGATDTFDLGPLDVAAPGNYELTVYLRYTQDDENRTNDTIRVSLVATSAQPSATIEVNQVGSLFYFSNASAQPGDNHLWDFGDGTTSTEASPTHEYTTSGTYDVRLIVNGFCGADTATVQVEGIGTAINELDLSKQLLVYPNPANKVLELQLGDGLRAKQFQIINILGQLVQCGALEVSKPINIEQLPSGSYIISIETNKGWTNQQFQVLKR